MLTYQLVAAHDGHDAQGLDAVRLGVEGLEAALVARVAEDDVRVDLGVEV